MGLDSTISQNDHFNVPILGHHKTLTKKELKAIKKERRVEKRAKRAQQQKNLKNAKKANKGKNMNFNLGRYFAPAQTITKPTDSVDNNSLNIVLFNQKFLNDIAEQCVPIAGDAEFQVHYRALQVILTHPSKDERLIYTFPTAFFNFSQTVSNYSVNYNLVEVDQISKKLQPASMKVAEQIAAVFPKKFFEDKGFEVAFREDEIGSIHRHPGDFSFSSIDLDNDPENPGVIYRRGVADDLVQTDSVMYLTGAAGNQHVKLVTTQTRIVTVNLLNDGTGGIEGTYAKAKTVALILQDSDTTETITRTIKSNFNHFFVEDTSNVETVEFKVLNNFTTRLDQIRVEDIEAALENTAKIFKLVSIKTAPISIIDEKLIKPNHYNHSGGYGYKKPTTTALDKTCNTFKVEDFLRYKGVVLDELNTKKLHTTILADALFVRELWWTCGGEDKKIKIIEPGIRYSISSASDVSTVLNVTINCGTHYRTKGIKENNDIEEEMRDMGYKNGVLLQEDDIDISAELLEEDSLFFDDGHALELPPEVVEENPAYLKAKLDIAKNKNLEILQLFGYSVGPRCIRDDKAKDLFNKAQPDALIVPQVLYSVYKNKKVMAEIITMLPDYSDFLLTVNDSLNTILFIPVFLPNQKMVKIVYIRNGILFTDEINMFPTKTEIEAMAKADKE